MDPLAQQVHFRSLSLKDLLEARETYHWHLMNKANVVGTAVGAYLIRGPGGTGPRSIAGSPRTSSNAQCSRHVLALRAGARA